jgi:hypothetical protein
MQSADSRRHVAINKSPGWSRSVALKPTSERPSVGLITDGLWLQQPNKEATHGKY